MGSASYQGSVLPPLLDEKKSPKPKTLVLQYFGVNQRGVEEPFGEGDTTKQKSLRSSPYQALNWQCFLFRSANLLRPLFFWGERVRIFRIFPVSGSNR